MRKNLFFRFASLFLLGAAVMVSCQRIQDTEDPTLSVSEPMTIVARMGATRTSNTGSGTVWDLGDQIGVLHCNADNPSTYYLEKFTNADETTFTGNVHNLSSVNNWYLMYPYRETFTRADDVHITVDTQVQTGNDSRAHMAGEDFPLYGRQFDVQGKAVSIDMQNILAIYRVSLTNTASAPIVVKRIILTLPHLVSGEFTGDLTQTPVEWTATENASNVIQLTVEGGEEIPVNNSTPVAFHIGVMPFSLTSGAKTKVQIVATLADDPTTEVSCYQILTQTDSQSWTSGSIRGKLVVFDENHQTDPGDPSNPDDPQPELTPRNLAFAQTELVWTLGQGYEVGNTTYDLPTLSGVTEGVTYTSTNEAVAVIVNGNKVRLVGDGMTTIKASALATSTYEAGEASLSLQVLPKQTEPSTTTTYTKVSSLTVGGTYLIVDKNDARLFTAATDGSYVNINPTNGVISDPTNSYAGYEFTVTQSGSKLCLMHNNQYLIDDYRGTSGNSTTGIVYESQKPADNYLYTCTVTDGVFFFTTKQRNGSDPNKDEYLYYKPSSMSGSDNNRFKLGGSGSTEGVHVYLKTAEGTTQQTQTISFDQPSVTVTLGSDYAIGDSFDMPTLSGAKTEVSYSSDNTGVAMYVDGKIKIMGVGTAVITATAIETAAWTGSTATLTVTINPASSSGTTTYTKVSSLTVGGTYLIVDKNDARLFTAATDGSYVNINPTNGVISDPTNSYAGYEFTVTQSGSKLCLMHNNQYLIDDYRGTSGNSTTGIVYESQKPADNYLYTCTVTDGVFFFTTKQRNGSDPNKDEYLYYKPSSMSGSDNNRFKLGGSGSTEGVHIYLKTNEGTPQQSQTISFTNPNPIWVVGQGYSLGSRYAIPDVTGNHTPLSYSIEPASVASIVNGQIQINGFGIATLTAVADETDQYSGATAQTTITIRDGSSTTTSAYVKVTSEPDNWAGTYLFVDETSGKAFAAFSNVTGYAVNVTINSDGTITSNSTVDTYALTVTDAGVAHANASGQEAYAVKNSAGNYVFYSSSTIQINSSNVRNNVSYYHAFKFFAAQGSTPAGVQVLSSGQSSGYNKYYLGYSSSAFGYAQSSDSRRVQLYKLSGDVTPTPGPGPDDPTPTTGTTYTMATALTVGGTYLVVDRDNVRLFTGNTNGSYVSVSPVNGVITDTTGDYADYEFTITQSGSKYCIMKDGKYLVCDYNGTNGNTGNNSTGLVYETQKPVDDYLYDYTVSNGIFEFSTTQRSSSNTGEVLYYKSSGDVFKIGGSGKGVGARLYLKDAGSSTKPLQNLSFAQSTVTLPLETATGTYSVQTVSGNAGAVTYYSSNPSVATVNGTTITITGFGETRISANAAETSTYAATSVYYTLVVSRTSQEGVWNLENDAVNQYLTAAMSSYPNSSSSVVGTYARNVSASNRLDWPNPVTVSWPTAITGTKYVVIYSDAAHASRVDYVGVTKSTSSSALVYNLIPGKTYYYGVVVGNSEVASGTFSTDGRRRMMKVGDDYGQNFANNCRDFGGQVTTDGRHIKYGKIFRGTNMDGCEPKSGQSVNSGFGKSSGALGDSAKVTLLNYMKIELDVDLRGSGNTLGTNQNNALGFNDITVGDANTYVGHTKETYAGTSELTDSNKQYNGKTRMGVTLTRIMNAAVNGKNVYIHCMVGADRTGFTCLMLESVLGVSQAYCDMDYEMTSFSGVGSRTRGNSGYVNHYSSGINAINNRQISGTFQDKAIDYIVNVHGVDRELINRFQNAMLE